MSLKEKSEEKSLHSFLIVAFILCCVLFGLILGGIFYSFTRLENPSPPWQPIHSVPPDSPTPTLFQITRQPADQIPTDTLKLLEGIIVPEDDLASLACRFKNVCNIPPTLPAPAGAFHPWRPADFLGN